MTISAWYMDTDEVSDQRMPHLPETPEIVSLQALTDLGVLSWSKLEGAGLDHTLSNHHQYILLIPCDR